MEGELKKAAQKRSFAITTTDDIKGRLGVLWVLLNLSTEYRVESPKVCELMDAIEKFAPGAKKAWNKDIMIFLDHKKVFHREAGE
jgi:hypothetical protein